MTPLATIEIESGQPAVVTRVIGEIDLSNAPLLGRQIIDAIRNDDPALVLDLAETRYLDSAGVRLVFDLAGRLQRRRQALIIVAPETAPAWRILDLADVRMVATVCGSVADALAPFAPPDSPAPS